MENSNWNFKDNSSKGTPSQSNKKEKIDDNNVSSTHISHISHDNDLFGSQTNFSNTNGGSLFLVVFVAQTHYSIVGNIFTPNDNFLYGNYGLNSELNPLLSISSILLGEHNFLNTTINNQPTNDVNLQRLYVSQTADPDYYLQNQNLTNTYDLFDEQQGDLHEQPINNTNQLEQPLEPITEHQQQQQQSQQPQQNCMDNVAMEDNNTQMENNYTQSMNQSIDYRLAEIVKGLFPGGVPQMDNEDHSSSFVSQINDNTINFLQQQHPQLQHDEANINYRNGVEADSNIVTSTNGTNTKRPYNSIEDQYGGENAPSKKSFVTGNSEIDPLLQLLQQQIQQSSNESNLNQWNTNQSNFNQFVTPQQFLNVNQPNNLNIINGQLHHGSSINTNTNINTNINANNINTNNINANNINASVNANINTNNNLNINNNNNPSTSGNNNPLINPQYNVLLNQYMSPPAAVTQFLNPMAPPLTTYPQSTPTFIPGINPNHMHLLRQNNYNPPYISTINGRPYLIANPRYSQLYSYEVHPTRQQIPFDRIIRSNTMVNPYSEGKFPKPVFSYSCLIAMALKNSGSGSLPVNEIYKYMQDKFPYFKTAPEGWKNSVRHNLSLNKAFYKIIRTDHSEKMNQRKGCFWALKIEKQHLIEKEINKWLRKHPDSIRRSLQDENDFESLFQNVEDSSDDTNDEGSVTLDMDNIKSYIIEQEEEKLRKQSETYRNFEFGENNHPTTSHEITQGGFTYHTSPSNSDLSNQTNIPIQNHDILNHNNVNFNNLNVAYNSNIPMSAFANNTNSNINVNIPDFQLNFTDVNQNIYAPIENNNANNVNANENNNNSYNNSQPQSNSDFVDYFLRHHQIPTQFPSSYLPMSPPSGIVDNGMNINNTLQQSNVESNLSVNNTNEPSTQSNGNFTQEQLNQLLDLSNHIRNISQTTSIQDLLNGSGIFHNGDHFNAPPNTTQSDEPSSNIDNNSNNENYDNINLNDIFNSFPYKNNPSPKQ